MLENRTSNWLWNSYPNLNAKQMWSLNPTILNAWIRAVRRRTGGRRRRSVVLWSAARRAFFIGGGGGVALWSAAAASDRMREHWNSALAGQAFFFWFTVVSHLTCDLRWRRKVKCEDACCAQFHSLNEFIVHCLISGGSYKCNVECWGDADSAGVEKRDSGKRGTGKYENKKYAKLWMAKRTTPKKQSSQVCCVTRFVIPVSWITIRKVICGVTDALRFICNANTVKMSLSVLLGLLF